MGEAGSRPSPPQSRGGRRSRQLGRQFRAQLRCLQMGVFIRRYIRRVAGTIKHAVRISRRDPLDGRPSVVHQNAIHCPRSGVTSSALTPPSLRWFNRTTAKPRSAKICASGAPAGSPRTGNPEGNTTNSGVG